MSISNQPSNELAKNFQEDVGPFLQASVENNLYKPILEKEKWGLLIDFFFEMMGKNVIGKEEWKRRVKNALWYARWHGRVGTDWWFGGGVVWHVGTELNCGGEWRGRGSLFVNRGGKRKTVPFKNSNGRNGEKGCTSQKRYSRKDEKTLTKAHSLKIFGQAGGPQRTPTQLKGSHKTKKCVTFLSDPEIPMRPEKMFEQKFSSEKLEIGSHRKAGSLQNVNYCLASQENKNRISSSAVFFFSFLIFECFQLIVLFLKAFIPELLTLKS